MRILVLTFLFSLAACTVESRIQASDVSSADVLPQNLEPTEVSGVSPDDPYFLSMMLEYDDRPVDLKASVVPLWSKDAVYRYQPGSSQSMIAFDIDDAQAGSLSLFVEGMSSSELSASISQLVLTQQGNGNTVELQWVVAEGQENLSTLLPYRGSVLSAVARASLPKSLFDQADSFVLSLGDTLSKSEAYLALSQPESLYELGVATERWLYHPSDEVVLRVELKESGEEMRVLGARGFLSPADGALSARAELVGQGLGGTLSFVLPSDAEEGRWDLTVELVGEAESGSFQRTVCTEIEVVRPHARINDATIRIDPVYGTGAAEVMIDIETKSPDRFSVYGTLTGYTDSGYEVPIAWARADATLDAGAREVMSLYFSVDDVVHAPVSGPYRLRNLTLASAYRGTIQERRAWTSLQTPAAWGLSMNRRLNRAMCLVLADAGHLPRAECPED